MRAHPGGPPAAPWRLGSARRPRTGDISSKNTLGKGKLTHTISALYPVSVAGPRVFVAESAERSANERNVDFLAVKLADGTSVRFAAKFDTLHQATRGEGFL